MVDIDMPTTGCDPDKEENDRKCHGGELNGAAVGDYRLDDRRYCQNKGRQQAIPGQQTEQPAPEIDVAGVSCVLIVSHGEQSRDQWSRL